MVSGKTFELVLKNEKKRQYTTLAFLILVVNVIFFIWLAITDRELRIKAILTAAIVTAGILIPYFLKRFSAIGVSVLFIILFYIEVGYWQLSVGIGVLALLFAVSIRRLIVQVTDGHIVYPSFPKREIDWGELNNLILKDGLLSIDFKSNKLAQALVVNEGNEPYIDEKEFNEFCQVQLGANRSQ